LFEVQVPVLVQLGYSLYWPAGQPYKGVGAGVGERVGLGVGEGVGGAGVGAGVGAVQALADWAPAEGCDRPAGQPVQPAAPVASWNVPGGHAWQVHCPRMS
jgi:hypothetical protein